MEGKTYSSGIGFVGLLTLLFATLKLVGEQFHTPVADWSWWLVLSPLWIGFGLWLLFLLVLFLVMAFVLRR